ncbi:hypothetical protein ABZP36_021634 [Zizania latifolia]
MPVVLAEAEAAPALAPDIATGSARRGFHVEVAVAAAPGAGRPGADVAEDGAARRPVRRRRRAGKGHGGGTGAWAFSAMLPRGFVPPSGSSACHNDMPATAVDAQFFMCGGAGSP